MKGRFKKFKNFLLNVLSGTLFSIFMSILMYYLPSEGLINNKYFVFVLFLASLSIWFNIFYFLEFKFKDTNKDIKKIPITLIKFYYMADKNDINHQSYNNLMLLIDKNPLITVNTLLSIYFLHNDIEEFIGIIKVINIQRGDIIQAKFYLCVDAKRIVQIFNNSKKDLEMKKISEKIIISYFVKFNEHMEEVNT